MANRHKDFDRLLAAKLKNLELAQSYVIHLLNEEKLSLNAAFLYRSLTSSLRSLRAAFCIARFLARFARYAAFCIARFLARFARYAAFCPARFLARFLSSGISRLRSSLSSDHSAYPQTSWLSR